MHAEIVAVGSELTSGARLDTNSRWLSRELGAVGIPVHYHTNLADDLDRMIAVFGTAAGRSDLVLITGGLGPTLDDLTRQALAGLLGNELILHEPSLQHIRSIFARRNRTMAERNVVQAMFPQGSEPLPNPPGTAPGIWVEIPRSGRDSPCRIAAMPGVPSEMKRMFRHEVLPRLSGSGRLIRHARLNCFGLGESDMEAMLGDLTARGRDPEVGITVHEATVTLRVIAHGRTAEECRGKLQTTEDEIRRKLGHLVFGTEDEELQHVAVRMLGRAKSTLSTAESGTGGLLAHRLTGVDGFQRCFKGGVVVPTDRAKTELLGVDTELLGESGPVSAAVAAAMARGCRSRFGTDFALSVTECPGFDPEDEQADSPMAYIALAGPDLLKTREQRLIGDPAITKSRVAKAALNLLRLHLLEAAEDGA